jgi:serine protease AprX
MAQPDDHAAIAVIVQSQQGMVKAGQAVKAAGGMITAELRLIRAVAARVDRSTLEKLARSSQLEAITLDYQAQSTSVGLEQNKFEPIAYAKGEPFPEKFYVAPLDLGAKKIWKDDITGVGVTVAVVDTGIEATKFLGRQTVDEDGVEHPQRLLAWVDFVTPDNAFPYDPHGHGTHVAGLIASNLGYKKHNTSMGVAPRANLVAVRVLDEQGAGPYSRVISGLQWVADHAAEYNIRVVLHPH